MIQLLDPETIGQIAAGEVVERPMSVVKELVENALDAGAHRITVRIAGGGLDEIEVIDDGDGIAPAELKLAVSRHATSKLRETSDLQRVTTLGFRGEGLASIASVSRLEIVSRTANSDIGSRIEAFAEQTGDVEPAASPVGTRVTARDLFGNIPVRRDFLRSASAEFSRISNWLGMMALAYPDTTFALAHDGRDVWILPSGDVVEQRLEHVFGKNLAHALIPLHPLSGAHEIGVSGFVSAPGTDRSDRRMQHLFVNGRLLRSGLLSGVWSAAYATFAMSGRHPFGVLFLALPPDHVDPNVHPTKTDVRLRYDRAVFETVRGTLTNSLRDNARERLSHSVSFSPLAATGGANGSQAPLFAADLEVVPESRTRVLAQLDATYILATDGNAVVLVDQHAAHERIAFEAIERNAALANHAQSEPLLVPFEFELDAAQSQALDPALESLRAAGLEIEPFGERVYRITATPAGYRWTTGSREFDIGEFLRDLSDETVGMTFRERVWASLACHSVVRAHEFLSDVEMRALLDQLGGCRNPMHCPHGRPTVVRLDAEAIARLFKRT
ncbi:MAG TPA: DNA mismatch repair endonuclease MutL [Candidatus Baltobacteraceae bacterium]